MRDLTLEELLKLATIDSINGKGIEAYQQMRAFQSGMEAIQHMAGHTQEEMGKQPIYTDISAPFQWGERQVCHAVEWLSPDHMRRCILDAETHQEITTLDLGEHVVHAKGVYTIHEVVESEERN